MDNLGVLVPHPVATKVTVIHSKTIIMDPFRLFRRLNIIPGRTTLGITPSPVTIITASRAIQWRKVHGWATGLVK